MLVKEFIQLRRDRVSFAMIIVIPLVQLTLFGYAINTTPRDLPTAVLLQEQTDLSRSILAALENTRYFKVTKLPRTEAEVDELLASGNVLFAIEIPANFERSVRRGDKPAMLVLADATDPVASGSALSRSVRCCRRRFRTTAPCLIRQCCRSRSARTRVTTQRLKPSSISSPGWSALSSP